MLKWLIWTIGVCVCVYVCCFIIHHCSCLQQLMIQVARTKECRHAEVADLDHWCVCVCVCVLLHYPPLQLFATTKAAPVIWTPAASCPRGAGRWNRSAHARPFAHWHRAHLRSGTHGCGPKLHPLPGPLAPVDRVWYMCVYVFAYMCVHVRCGICVCVRCRICVCMYVYVFVVSVCVSYLRICAFMCLVYMCVHVCCGPKLHPFPGLLAPVDCLCVWYICVCMYIVPVLVHLVYCGCGPKLHPLPGFLAPVDRVCVWYVCVCMYVVPV